MTVALGACLVSTTALVGNAVAAPPDSSSASGARHCNTVVKRVHPDQPDARVVSRQCTDNPAARPLPAPKNDVAIVTFYDKPDYQGNSDTIYGDYTCDSAGYGFADLSDVLDGWTEGGITSYQLHSGCNRSFVYDDYDYSGNMLPRNGNQRALPYNWVDNVYSMRTWAQS